MSDRQMIALLEAQRDHLHNIIDDLELVADEETADEYRERVDELLEDIDQAFDDARA